MCGAHCIIIFVVRSSRQSENYKNLVAKNEDITYTKLYQEALEENAWKQRDSELQTLVGTKTANGVVVTSIDKHCVEQSLKRNVEVSHCLDALVNPLHVSSVRYSPRGEPSQLYIGNSATIAVNPDTGKAVTVYTTGSRVRKKYGGKP